MSRTDKDLPYWFTEWWTPNHASGCQYAMNTWRTRFRAGDRICNLPPEPDVSRYRVASRIHRLCPQNCEWAPLYTWRQAWWRLDHPNREDRHFEWWGPERAATRDWAKDQIKRHRANEEYDPCDPRRDHRHNPRNGWWN